jgi:hypothetical protein
MTLDTVGGPSPGLILLILLLGCGIILRLGVDEAVIGRWIRHVRFREGASIHDSPLIRGRMAQRTRAW